ncbi:hypothetical protein NIBR502774_14485 (plasmid) [Rhizobium sp. NIBRBAC000502774]|jgi:DHA1 family inner membrane transport protein|uniref:hypothetical protein n=1 Tax=Agrobacterium tumefaciens TaxID=358 RepID=UPI00080FEE54|nr:hypothetical protein NIBR502774_14485 [Rhizobium sp. NIBRBAC000502774]
MFNVRNPVLAALALTVLGSSAMFTVFTCIAPILYDITHAATVFVAAMLVLSLQAGRWAR